MCKYGSFVAHTSVHTSVGPQTIACMYIFTPGSYMLHIAHLVKDKQEGKGREGWIGRMSAVPVLTGMLRHR